MGTDTIDTKPLLPEALMLGQEAQKEFGELKAAVSQKGWHLENTGYGLQFETIAIEPSSMKVATRVIVTMQGPDGNLDIPRLEPTDKGPENKIITGKPIAQVEISLFEGQRMASPEKITAQLLSDGTWIAEEPLQSDPTESRVGAPRKETPTLVHDYLFKARPGQRPFYKNEEELREHIRKALTDYRETHRTAIEDAQRRYPHDPNSIQSLILNGIISDVSSSDPGIPNEYKLVLGFAANIQKEALREKMKKERRS